MNYLKEIGKFLLRHFEIPILAIIFTAKMYWFATENGLDMISKHTLLVTIGTVLLWFCIALLFHRRARLWVLGSLQLLGSFIVYADLLYYRYFGDFVTTPVLAQSNQASDISASIIELMALTDLRYFIDVIVVIAIAIFMTVKKSAPAINVKERMILYVLVFGVGYSIVNNSMDDYTEKYGTGLLTNMYSNEAVYEATGHIGFHYVETKKHLKEVWFGKPAITAEEKESMIEAFSGQQKTPSNAEWFGVAEGKNVLMIQLESFQEFAINKSINGEEITPNLNALISETLNFSNFYHQTGQGRTSDAELLTNASLYPLSGGSAYVRYPQNDYDSLAKLLKKENYSTRAYHAHIKNFWNRDGMYRNYGFDEFIAKGDLFARAEVNELYGNFQTMGDEQLFLESLKDAKEGEPFYHFIVALTSHHPYSWMPASASNLNVAPFEEDIFGHYLKSINYTDRSVGTLVKELKEKGLWEETVVILYGDHDSGIPWKPEYAEALGENFDEMSSYNNLKKVPLFIHIPGNEKLEEVKTSVGMIDIAPTILELLGIQGEFSHLGSSVLDFKDHLVPFRDGSAIKGNVLYKASAEGGSCFEVVSEEEMQSDCSPLGEEANKNVQASDMMIYHDLSEEFKKRLSDK